jgi:hypothetical protein
MPGKKNDEKRVVGAIDAPFWLSTISQEMCNQRSSDKANTLEFHFW